MLKKEPAVLIALVAAAVAAAAQIQQAAAGGGWWAAVAVAAPLLAGILTRYKVVPAEAVRAVISRARSTSAAVSELADRVDVAVGDRPGGGV